MNLGYGKSRGGGGGGQMLNSIRGVLHMLSLWHANSQAKFFSDCTNDLIILCLL